jgi:hypothetical protein
MSVRPASQYPCAPDAHASIRLAAVRGDAHLIRRILAESDEQLDVSKLTAVLHLLVRLGLVNDLLRAGTRAETLSTTLQELWVGDAVTAGLVDDARALLQAGFEAAPETQQDIRLRAIRSDSWKDLSAKFGAGQDAQRRRLAWLHIHPTL